MSAVCQWGILGTANIARKNWHAIFNAGNSNLLAVASRTPDRATQFIHECQASVPFTVVPQACTYEALLANPNIHAVYIPIPTGLRKEWVMRAAEAKKHVLCEKPCAVNAADLAEMTEACRKNNVQFMDGVMFMHSQRLPQLRQVLNDGHSIGEIRRITSQFSFAAPAEFHAGNIRVSNELEPLGCLGDLGWYNTRFALWVMNYAMPTEVSGRLLKTNAAGVPLEFSAEMFFANGTTASYFCSFLTENQQWANISGSKGFVQVPDFVLSFYGAEAGFNVTNAHFETLGCRFNMEDHTRRVAIREYSNNMPGSPETNMIRTFSDLVLSGKRDDSWPEIAEKTQQVLNACLTSAQQNGALVKLG
jgi:predicted dehydrogenase